MSGGPGRVVARADQDEVVVHDVVALDAVTLGDEGLLGGTVMDQQDVGVAVAGQAQGLAGADRDDPDRDAGRRR